MRTLIKNLMLAVIVLTLGGCMQHNGDIGDWFGTWKLEAMTIDGAEDPSYEGNIFFKFQTGLVSMVEVYPYQEYTDRFGTWQEVGSTLILDFGYTSDNKEAFTPLPATRLAADENLLNIDHKSSRSMRWTLHKPDGSTITYSLKKQ